MGGWWDAYSFRCQPVEHETYGRPMRVSFNRKVFRKNMLIFLEKKKDKKWAYSRNIS